MAKPRRPKGPRSTWEPKSVPAEAPAAAVESPILNAPAPVASLVIESPIEQAAEAPVHADAVEVAEIAAEEVLPTSASPTRSLAVLPAQPFDIGAHAAAEPAPPVETESTGPSAPLAPAPPSAGFQMTFSPERIDLAGIGETITGYMRGEGAAAAAHLRALGGARSPADMIRLQVGELQRAADASLTCWSQVARKASRAFASR